MSETSGIAPDKVLVGRVSDFASDGRKTVTIGEREITVFKVQEALYALDSRCYHTGGPLNEGYIQDIEDVTCIVCPWHKYKISLSTGEGFYQAIDPKNPKKPPCWKSKGKKQRTHHVVLEEGNVYVSLNLGGDQLESDFYFSEEYKARMKGIKR